VGHQQCSIPKRLCKDLIAEGAPENARPTKFRTAQWYQREHGNENKILNFWFFYNCFEIPEQVQKIVLPGDFQRSIIIA